MKVTVAPSRMPQSSKVISDCIIQDDMLERMPGGGLKMTFQAHSSYTPKATYRYTIDLSEDEVAQLSR